MLGGAATEQPLPSGPSGTGVFPMLGRGRNDESDQSKEAASVLDVTSSASLVIRELVASSNATGGAGLRIAPTDEPEGAFALSVAPGPQQDDQVVPIEDGEVFLEPTAAQALDDKTLDAEVDPEGAVSFSVIDQQAS
jgi:iron-sulfur cluster assembly protein